LKLPTEKLIVLPNPVYENVWISTSSGQAMMDLVLFMIPCDSQDIQKEYEILSNELHQFNPELTDKPRLLAITKTDIAEPEWKDLIQSNLPKNIPCVFVSAVAHQGLEELKDLIWKNLNP